MSPLGAILAGGKSSRMGRDKALMPLRGKPMITWIVETMESVFDDVMIVADEGSRYNFPGLKVIPDVVKKSGPLGGIHAALTAAAPSPVVFMPCDMPFVTADLLRELLNYPSDKPIRVLWDGTRIFPLCGLYGQSILPLITARLRQRQLRMTDLLDELGAERVNPLQKPWFKPEMLSNINSPEDFR
jgi:molybdopterin-guanine dinucleotide biosynthesis protein A